MSTAMLKLVTRKTEVTAASRCSPITMKLSVCRADATAITAAEINKMNLNIESSSLERDVVWIVSV